MNRNELFSLLILREKGAKAPATAMTLKEIAAEDAAVKSVNTLYKILKKLVISGYVSCGLPDGRAATYYITDAGLTKIGEFES